MVTKEKNEYLDLNSGFDFGFTAMDEEDVVSTTAYTSLNDEVIDLKKRLQAVEKMFLPLLQNLLKDADKPMIKWPDRGEVITKQIDLLLKITRP